jgi:hypothetical protein
MEELKTIALSIELKSRSENDLLQSGKFLKIS